MCSFPRAFRLISFAHRLVFPAPSLFPPCPGPGYPCLPGRHPVGVDIKALYPTPHTRPTPFKMPIRWREKGVVPAKSKFVLRLERTYSALVALVPAT